MAYRHPGLQATFSTGRVVTLTAEVAPLSLPVQIACEVFWYWPLAQLVWKLPLCLGESRRGMVQPRSERRQRALYLPLAVLAWLAVLVVAGWLLGYIAKTIVMIAL